jgi:hypothetical protein
LNHDADYCNQCSVVANVPYAGAGFQYAKSGVGFAGVYTLNNYGFNYREYIQTELTTILSSNAYYKISFYCSSMGTLTYSTNNIGLNFSAIPIETTGNGNVLSLTADILKFGNPVISDSLNWVEIMGIYRAAGTEQFITIGNFRDDLNTEILNMGNNNYQGAYYYIDDVLVEEITQPFWQYHDTTIYYGDSVLIGPALTGLDIDWYTDNLDFISNAPGIYVTPPTSRDYIAKETFNGVETDHVVHVTVIGGAGLQENELQHVRVFPNPSKGNFSISGLMSDKPLQLEVRDVHGKLVFEENEVSKELNSFELDVENGIYFVTVSDMESKGFVVEKLVVSR